MKTNFFDFAKTIKKEFVSILFISILISSSLSYLLLNSSKMLISKVELTFSKDNEFDDLINLISSLENEKKTHPINRELLDNYVKKIKNFKRIHNNEFSTLIYLTRDNLEDSPTIKKNNRGRLFVKQAEFPIIIFEKLVITSTTKDEVNKIMNSNNEKYSKKINFLIDEISKISFSNFKLYKKNHEDYLRNYEILRKHFLKNMPDFLKLCLVKCYYIKSNINQKIVDKNFKNEIQKKIDIVSEYKSFLEKFDLIEKKLNYLSLYKYKNLNKIKIANLNPVLSFSEIFIFLFLISISIVSIFFLFKNHLDEQK